MGRDNGPLSHPRFLRGVAGVFAVPKPDSSLQRLLQLVALGIGPSGGQFPADGAKSLDRGQRLLRPRRFGQVAVEVACPRARGRAVPGPGRRSRAHRAARGRHDAPPGGCVPGAAGKGGRRAGPGRAATAGHGDDPGVYPASPMPSFTRPVLLCPGGKARACPRGSLLRRRCLSRRASPLCETGPDCAVTDACWRICQARGLACSGRRWRRRHWTWPGNDGSAGALLLVRVALARAGGRPRCGWP